MAKAHETTEALQAKGIAPGFTVNDLEKSLHFYTEGLGFEVTETQEEDGKIRFAMMKAGNAHLGIGQDDFKKGRDRVKGVGMRMWITTDQDVTALAERAKAAGLKLDSEPAALPWGPMGFALTDPDGFALTISNDG